jgi:hypothetical protein
LGALPNLTSRSSQTIVNELAESHGFWCYVTHSHLTFFLNPLSLSLSPVGMPEGNASSLAILINIIEEIGELPAIT